MFLKHKNSSGWTNSSRKSIDIETCFHYPIQLGCHDASVVILDALGQPREGDGYKLQYQCLFHPVNKLNKSDM